MLITEPFLEKDGSTSIYEVRYGQKRIIRSSDLYTDQYDDTERKYYAQILNTAVWKLPDSLDPRSIPRDTEGKPDLKNIEERIEKYLRRYVYIEDDGMYPLLANWVIMTYYRRNFNYSPLVIIDGVTSAGKSTLQSALAAVSYRGFCTSNYSSAAVVRLIKKFNVSVFLDESLDNITGERGTDLMNLIKSVVMKDTPYVRAVPRSKDDVEICFPYTSMAVSVKGAEIATDVINRGIKVQMVAKPPDIDLGDFNWADTDDLGSDFSAASIRRDLYNVMIFNETAADDRTDWQLRISESQKYLTKKVDGIWMYAYVFEIDEAPRIRNRLRDIATSFLPIAIETHTERETIMALISTEQVHSESANLSMEARVFRAFVDCVKNSYDSIYGHMRGKGPITRAEFLVSAADVTTKDIADRYNTVLHSDGEISPYEIVETRKVTNTVKSLGISYTMGRGSGGRASTIDPSGKDFPYLFTQYLEAYDCENINFFSNIVEKRVNKEP